MSALRRTKILTTEEAKARAMALCDKCEQCSPDILRKLSTWGIPQSTASKIIKELEDMRYLDDMRFARAYAHDKMAYSGWGRNKIVTGLWAKRLGREYIDASCDELDPEEYAEVAERVIRSKARSLPDGLSTYENRMKVLKFAVGRGFEIPLASEILRRLHRKETEGEEDGMD